MGFDTQKIIEQWVDNISFLHPDEREDCGESPKDIITWTVEECQKQQDEKIATLKKELCMTRPHIGCNACSNCRTIGEVFGGVKK